MTLPYELQMHHQCHLQSYFLDKMIKDKNTKVFVGPSILSADFADLAKDCQQVIDLGADSLHIDVMDGHFVPNLTIGPPVIKCLRAHLPNVHFDCHLNVTHPRSYVDQMSKIGINCFTFHYESEHGGLKELCEMIRNNNMEVGLALSPKTPVDGAVEELIAEGKVDKILVMSVEPGFGGQKFIPQVLDKVRYLNKKFPNLHIQVDGGIGPDNSAMIAQSGANWLVAGSAIFCAKDRQAAIENIRGNATKGIQSRQ